MKTKLLRRLRRQSKCRYGVFFNKNNGLYEVVHDLDLFSPDLSMYGDNDKYPEKQYEVVEGISNIKKAKALCDAYRRVFILREIRQMRYGNRRRMY